MNMAIKADIKYLYELQYKEKVAAAAKLYEVKMETAISAVLLIIIIIL